MVLAYSIGRQLSINMKMKNLISKTFRPDIQTLRGLAVLGVVVFHAWENLLPSGYLGVDIFFVISGFVVTPLMLRITTKSKEEISYKLNLLSFYKRRFFRLAPAMGCTLILSAFIVTFLGNINDLQRFARQGILTNLLLGNLGALKYSGNYFSPNPNPLIHTWSLSVEEQIYLVFPILMILVSTLAHYFKIQILYFVIFLLSVSIFLLPEQLGLLYDISTTHTVLDLNFYSPVSRLWQFSFGGLIYFASLSSRFLKLRTSRYVQIGSVASILLLLLNQFSLDYRVLVFTTSILVGVAIDSKAIERVPSKVNDLFRWLGDRSYSIYLLHMPLIYVAKFSPLPLVIKNRQVALLLAVVLTLALGAVSFRYIEERFRIRDEKLPTKKVPPIKLVVVAVVLPLSLFVGIDSSAKQNHRLILGPSKSLEIVDQHVLSLKGCVDIVFDPVKCLWKVPDTQVGEAIIVGDSQAYANADGIIPALNAQGLNVIASSSSGCPMLLVDTSGDKSVDCKKWQDDVFKHIEKNKPSFVIISNRTFGYLNPNFGWRTFLDEKGNPIRERNLALQKYSEALQNTISRIVSVGSKVIIVQDIPEPQSFNGQSIGQLVLGVEASPSVPLAEMNIDFEVIDLEMGIAKRNERVFLFNPAKSLCKDANCIISQNGNNIYMDGWHLSRFGSIKLQEKFSTLVGNILKLP